MVDLFASVARQKICAGPKLTRQLGITKRGGLGAASGIEADDAYLDSREHRPLRTSTGAMVSCINIILILHGCLRGREPCSRPHSIPGHWALMLGNQDKRI